MGTKTTIHAIDTTKKEKQHKLWHTSYETFTLILEALMRAVVVC
jgi:hypothetical protein